VFQLLAFHSTPDAHPTTQEAIASFGARSSG